MIQMTDSPREEGMINPNSVKIRAKRRKRKQMTDNRRFLMFLAVTSVVAFIAFMQWRTR